MVRVRLAIVVVLLTLLPAIDAAPALAAPSRQTSPASDEATAAEAARELSRLEAARNYAALYDLMHPDSRAEVSEQAVVGWYRATYAGTDTAELTVLGVDFVAWTWPVTGETYDQTAQVTFSQPYVTDGVREDVTAIVHLVESDGEWGWFFGNSRAFVDEQIARYGGEPGAATEAPAVVAEEPDSSPTAPGDDATEPIEGGGDDAPLGFDSGFVNPLDADIDRYWAGAFAVAGLDYDPPDGIVGFDAPVETACGLVSPNEAVAFYCPADETIYYVAPFRALIEERVGDFGWITVVSHEWGHHIQYKTGAFEDAATTREEIADGATAPIELELQADCLAGAYTRDAERRQWLDPGDLEEALLLTEVAGDPDDVPSTDLNAHGSSDDRVESFLAGYDDGLAGCDLDL